MSSGDDDRDNDPMEPSAWYGEPDVCGSCIAWRPGPAQEGDDVATGSCRLRPELGRVPASLKLCDLYKPRGQFVYTPSKDAGRTRRKKASAPRVLRRTDSGEMVPASPPKAPRPTAPAAPRPRERPPEETYVPPREIDMGEDANFPAIRATFRDLIHEELGKTRREMAQKYKGGSVRVVVDGQSSEQSMTTLFSILDRLKTSVDRLEEELEKHGLESEVANVKKIRGSFTTLNVLWADREDYFSGK